MEVQITELTEELSLWEPWAHLIESGGSMFEVVFFFFSFLFAIELELQHEADNNICTFCSHFDSQRQSPCTKCRKRVM